MRATRLPFLALLLACGACRDGAANNSGGVGARNDSLPHGTDVAEIAAFLPGRWAANPDCTPGDMIFGRDGSLTGTAGVGPGGRWALSDADGEVRMRISGGSATPGDYRVDRAGDALLLERAGQRQRLVRCDPLSR